MVNIGTFLFPLPYQISHISLHHLASPNFFFFPVDFSGHIKYINRWSTHRTHEEAIQMCLWADSFHTNWQIFLIKGEPLRWRLNLFALTAECSSEYLPYLISLTSSNNSSFYLWRQWRGWTSASVCGMTLWSGNKPNNMEAFSVGMKWRQSISQVDGMIKITTMIFICGLWNPFHMTIITL